MGDSIVATSHQGPTLTFIQELTMELRDSLRADAIMEYAAQELGFRNTLEASHSSEWSYLQVCSLAIRLSDLDAASANRAFLRLLYKAFTLRPTSEGLIEVITTALPEGSQEKYIGTRMNKDGIAVLKVQPLFNVVEAMFASVYHGAMTMDQLLDVYADSLRLSRGSTTRDTQAAGLAMMKAVGQFQARLRRAVPPSQVNDPTALEAVQEVYLEEKDEMTDIVQTVTKASRQRKDGTLSRESYVTIVHKTLDDHGLVRRGTNYSDTYVTVKQYIEEVPSYDVQKNNKPRGISAHKIVIFRIPIDDKGRELPTSITHLINQLADRAHRWAGGEGHPPTVPATISVKKKK